MSNLRQSISERLVTIDQELADLTGVVAALKTEQETLQQVLVWMGEEIPKAANAHQGSRQDDGAIPTRAVTKPAKPTGEMPVEQLHKELLQLLAQRPPTLIRDIVNAIPSERPMRIRNALRKSCFCRIAPCLYTLSEEGKILAKE